MRQPEYPIYRLTIYLKNVEKRPGRVFQNTFSYRNVSPSDAMNILGGYMEHDKTKDHILKHTLTIEK